MDSIFDQPINKRYQFPVVKKPEPQPQPGPTIPPEYRKAMQPYFNNVQPQLWKPDQPSRFSQEEINRFMRWRSQDFNLAAKKNLELSPYPQGFKSEYEMDPNLAVSISDKYWDPEARYDFWQQPQRVARYYSLIKNAPADWKPPEWLDVDGVQALYHYLEEKNNYAPWYNWKALNRNDPAMEYINKNMKLPPPEVMWDAEKIYGTKGLIEYYAKQQEQNGTQNIANWNDLERWQQLALFAFSPQPMDNRPTWTRLAPVNAVLQGLGGAAVGGAIGGVPGAVMGATIGAGASLYTNITGQKVPLLSDLLYAFNLPAEWTEQGIGVIKQAVGEDWAFEELIDNLPEAWKASKITYEAYGGPGQGLLNLMARVSGDEPAPEGYAWMLQEGLSEPQKIKEPRRLLALTQARSRVSRGEDAITVYMDMVQNYGYGGTLNDFILQSVIDPMQLSNLAQSKILKSVGDQYPNLRLAQAAEQAGGRWYIDVLPIGVQNAVQGAMKLAGLDEYYFRSSSGILGTYQQWKNLIRTGSWGENISPIAAKNLPSIEKMLGYLDENGIPRELLPTSTAPGIKGWLQRMRTLTPVSRAYAYSDIANKNIGLLVRIADSPEDIKAAFRKAAGIDVVKAGDIGEALIKSPEVAAVQGAIKDFYEKGKLDTLLAEYKSVDPQRALLETLASSIEKTTGETLELIKNTPEEAARLIQENKKGKAALKAYGIEGTADQLTDTFKVFNQENQTPWSINELKATAMNAMNDHVDSWTAEKFNIKPDHWIYRMTNLLKGVQSLMMLNTVSYLTQNVTNNAIMLPLYEGVTGFMTPKQIDNFITRSGISSQRLTGQNMVNIMTQTDPNKPTILKAKDSNDWMSKANRVVRQVNKQLGVFANASQRMEELQGRSATAAGYMQMWNSLWRYGKSIPEMPGNLAMQLDSVAPGFKNLLISAAESGMNMNEIYTLVKKPIIQRNVNDFITRAAKQMFPTAPEIGEDLMNATGIRYDLQKMLEGADTIEKQQAAFTLVKEKITETIDMLHGSELQARAKEIATTIKTEGWKSVQTIFQEMKTSEMVRRLEHYYEASKVAEEAMRLRGEGEYTKASNLWHNFFQEENRKFKRDQDFQSQTMAGIIKGLGMDTPQAKEYINAMVKYYRTYRDFFEGYYVDKRNGRRVTITESMKMDPENVRKVKGKQDILRDLYSQDYGSKEKFQVAKDQAQQLIKELWTEQQEIAKATQMQMDQLFITMWDQVKPGEGAKARQWRSEVWDMTEEFYRELEIFWDDINMTKDPAKINSMWSKFTRNTINPMLKNLYEAGEVQGFNRLINGKFEGLELEIPAKLQGEAAEPGAVDAADISTPNTQPVGPAKQIDMQKISNEVGTHAATKQVLSEAEQLKAAAAKHSHAILTRRQVKQQIETAFPNASHDEVYAALYLMDTRADLWAKKNKPDMTLEEGRDEWYGTHIARIVSDGDKANTVDSLDQLYQEAMYDGKWYYSKAYEALLNLPAVIKAEEATVIPDRYVPPRKPGKWQDNPNLPDDVRKNYTEGYTITGKTIPGRTASEVFFDLMEEAGVKREEMRWFLPEAVMKKTEEINNQKVTTYEMGRVPFEESGQIKTQDLLDEFDRWQIKWDESKSLGYNSRKYVNPREWVSKTFKLFRYPKISDSDINYIAATMLFLNNIKEQTNISIQEFMDIDTYNYLIGEYESEGGRRADIFIEKAKSANYSLQDYIEKIVSDGLMNLDDIRYEFWRATQIYDIIDFIIDDPESWEQARYHFTELPAMDEYDQNYTNTTEANEAMKLDILNYIAGKDYNSDIHAWMNMNIDDTMDAMGVTRQDAMAQYIPKEENAPQYPYFGDIGQKNYREVLMTVEYGDIELKGPSSHFGSDYAAWARLGDVEQNGKRYLYIHEIQSDFAQNARDKGYIPVEEYREIMIAEREESLFIDEIIKQGYVTTQNPRFVNWARVMRERPDLWAETQRLSNRVDELKFNNKDYYAKTIKEFPNMAHWEEMVMKKIIHTAAKEGYDGVMYTNAEEQFKMWGSERYEWKLLQKDEVSNIKRDIDTQLMKLELFKDETSFEPETIIGVRSLDEIDGYITNWYDAIKNDKDYDKDIFLQRLYEDAIESKSVNQIIEEFLKDKKAISYVLNNHTHSYNEKGYSLHISRDKVSGIRVYIHPSYRIHGYKVLDWGLVDPTPILFYLPKELINFENISSDSHAAIQLSAKEYFGGQGANNMEEILQGRTIEEFANETGQNKYYEKTISLDPKKSRSEIAEELIDAFSNMGMKKNTAIRNANAILSSINTEGVIMPRYEGMKAAYDIRATSNIEDILKEWNGKVKKVSIVSEVENAMGEYPFVMETTMKPNSGILEGDITDPTSYETEPLRKAVESLVPKGDREVLILKPKTFEVVKRTKISEQSSKNIKNAFNHNEVDFISTVQEMIEMSIPIEDDFNFSKYITVLADRSTEANNTTKRHVIEITQEMRDSITTNGLPLFQYQDPGVRKTYSTDLIQNLDKVGYIPNYAISEIVHGIEPQNLYDIQNFLIEKRLQLQQGNITQDDVAKAWVETVGGMRGGTIELQKLIKHMDNAMPGYEFTIPEYLKTHKGNKVYITAEEAIAAWFNTEEGMAQIKNIGQGTADFETLLTIRDAFGPNTLRDWLFGENKQGQMDMASLQEITDAVNRYGIDGDIKGLGDYMAGMIGVGRNKYEVVKHLLGMGNSYDIGSDMLEAWVTGKKPANWDQMNRNLIDDMNRRLEAVKDPETRKRMKANLNARINELNEMRYSVQGMDPDVLPTAIFNYLWGKTKRTISNQSPFNLDVYKNQADMPTTRKGSTQFLADGRAIIRAFEQGDITTLVHEVGHVFMRDLEGADLEAMAKYGGLEDANELIRLRNKMQANTITSEEMERLRGAEETFAYGWEIYMGERKPYLPPQMQTVFQKFTTWIQGIYANLVHKLGIRIPEGSTEPWKDAIASSAEKGGAYRAVKDIDQEIMVGTQRRTMREIFDGLLMDTEGSKIRRDRQVQIQNRPAGTTTMATGVMDANKEYNFRYRLVDMDEVITSHDNGFNENPLYPQVIQNKDRASKANQDQVHENARLFAPNKVLLDTHTLQHGIPIILPDGTVIAGNGRILSMREAAQLYPDRVVAYRNQLERDLTVYGFTQQDMEGIKNPVLVRELQDEVDLVMFSKEANKRDVMETSASETAVDDAFIIGPEAINKLEITPNQTLDDAIKTDKNIPFVNELLRKLPQSDRATLIDSVGIPSEDGVKRIKNALFAATYNNEAGVRLLRTFSESADPGIKRIESAMMDTIGQAAMVESMIKQGLRDQDLSIAGDIANAIDLYRRLKAQGENIQDYLGQLTLQAREQIRPFDAEMLKFIDKYANSVGKMRDTLQSYYKSILMMPSDEQGALIGEARPSKGTILDGITSKFYDEANFKNAEAAQAKGDTATASLMDIAGEPMELRTMLPAMHGEFMTDRRYIQGWKDIAYLTPDMDPNTMVDTPQGPAKLLGLDPDDPNSLVYQMKDGTIYSTREPADEGLYQTMFGHESYLLAKNPEIDLSPYINTKAGYTLHDQSEPISGYGWILPDGRWVKNPNGMHQHEMAFKNIPKEITSNFKNHDWSPTTTWQLAHESGLVRFGEDGRDISITTMPTPEQILSIINSIETKSKTKSYVIDAIKDIPNWDYAFEDYIDNATKEDLIKYFDSLTEGDPKSLYQKSPRTRYSKPEQWEIIDNAKQMFPKTNNVLDAGWILPDGTMLDLQRSKQREWIEHATIIKAFNEYKMYYEEGININDLPDEVNDNAIIGFMDMGNIRTTSWTSNKTKVPEVGFEMTTEGSKISPEQILIIYESAKKYNIIIDNYEGDGVSLPKGTSLENINEAIERMQTSQYGRSIDPIVNLFQELDEGKQQNDTLTPQPHGEMNNENEVWKLAATHKDHQGKSDLAGVDENGTQIPGARMKLIRYIKRWGNPNDRKIVKKFNDITPEILERSITREEAYLMAQMRMDNPTTDTTGAPVEGQYEDQMPANQYQGRAMDELASEHLKPMLENIENSYLSAARNQQYQPGRLPDQVQQGVDDWLGQVEHAMPQAKRTSLAWGETKRDNAMLNYSSRVGFDNLLNVFFPYQFWYTRSMGNWARRMIDMPEWMAMYARVKKTQEKMEKEGYPSRLKERSRMPAPYLPDWMGGGIYFDPYKTIFPFDNFGQPLRNVSRMSNNLQYDAEEQLYNMVQEGTITQEQMDEAKQTHEGDAWLQAVSMAKEQDSSEISDPMNMVSTMMTPAMWWTAPYYSMRGQPEKIQVMPATKQGRAFRHALEGTVLEPVGYLLGIQALPEEGIRKMMDLNILGEYGDYFVDRQLANMAADGSAAPDAVLDAMVTRQGETFDQAIHRVEQEMAVRYPGMLPLFAMKGKADMKGVIGSLLGALSGSGQLLPEGELIQRGLQKEYNKAWEDLESGDQDAINNFFKKYPEYRTRLMMFQEPKDRMRNHLVNLIWDGYGQLARPNKSLVKKQLGQEFQDKFYDRETRDYESIKINTLISWAMLLGKEVPETEEAKQIREAGLPKLQQYPAMDANIIEIYQNKRDEQFPKWFEQQTEYYALPEGQARRDYLQKTPSLKEYWDWKRDYKQNNPEMEQWFQDQSAQQQEEGIDISGLDPIVLRQLMLYAYGLESNLGVGATMELQTLYEQSNSPANTFEDYLEAVKLVVNK